MENQFSRLGQIIFDLHVRKQFDLSEESNFQFLDEEFTRIILHLGLVWKQKELGWSYCLEFHETEGQRLLQKLRVDPTYLALLAYYQEEQKDLYRVYKMLFHILTELLKRIDILRYGKDIDMSWFDTAD